jgi:hypothetical protein
MSETHRNPRPRLPKPPSSDNPPRRPRGAHPPRALRAMLVASIRGRE